MFNGVQYVRDICKAKGIAISQLEKECGFSNGYLNPKKMTKIPYDRAIVISEYLNIPVTSILEGPDSKKAPAESGKRSVSDAELKFALWGDCEDVSDDDLADVLRYAAFVRERKKDKK